MLLLITPGVFELFKSARLVIATLYDLLMGQSTLDMLPLLFNCPPAAHLSRGGLKTYQTDFRSRNFQFPMRTGTYTSDYEFRCGKKPERELLAKTIRAGFWGKNHILIIRVVETHEKWFPLSLGGSRCSCWPALRGTDLVQNGFSLDTDIYGSLLFLQSFSPALASFRSTYTCCIQGCKPQWLSQTCLFH